MKSILVASDLSARSDWAIDRAAKLAAYHDARLTVLHVIDDELPAKVADRLRVETQASLSAFVAGLEAAQIARTETRCELGEHFSTILNIAEREAADLVVIGRHRADKLLDLFRGSTGERVVRFGNRPTLVVKQRPMHGYRHVLVGVDFSPASARALELAHRLVPGGRIAIAHAFHLPFKGFLHGGRSLDEMAKSQQVGLKAAIEHDMAQFFASLRAAIPVAERLIEEGHPGDVLLNAVEARKPDLLVVGTHGRTGFGRAILGSVAEAMLARAPCDVLAVPQRR